MKINVNGRDKNIDENTNILELLSIYNINDITKVVVEYNGGIIEYIQYNTTILKEDDNIEIVSFVGGG